MNEIVIGLNPNKTYKVVFYARVSTEEEKQLNALEKQVEELSEFIKYQPNWILVDSYVDEGRTGTMTKGRHEYNRLYEDMLTDKFDIVVMKNIERMNRNTGNYYQFINRITTENKKLYLYLDRKFYTSEHAFINGIKAMMAEEDSRKLTKKINSAANRSIKGGVAYGNGRIYGYDKIPRSYVINEEEAVIVRKIFNWYVNGYGFRTIQKKLTEIGVFSSTGTQFSLSTLKRMIKNEKYKGLLVSGKTKYNFETKKTEVLPPEQRTYIPNGIPAIVSEEIWEKANAIINKKSQVFNYDSGSKTGKFSNRFAPEQSVLSGKIHCGKCGKVYWHSPYITKVNRLRRDIWMCSTYKSLGVKYCKNHSIEFDKILDEVRQVLYLENQNCTSIKLTLDILNQTLDENQENKITGLTKQIERYNKRLSNLTDLLLDDLISKEEYTAKKEEIISKIKNLQLSIEQESTHNASLLSKKQRLKDIKDFLETNIVKPEDITDDDIRKFIKDIRVFNDVIVVETTAGNTYNIDPDKVKLKYAPRNKKYLQSLKCK